jgi:hypothetical protein
MKDRSKSSSSWLSYHGGLSVENILKASTTTLHAYNLSVMSNISSSTYYHPFPEAFAVSHNHIKPFHHSIRGIQSLLLTLRRCSRINIASSCGPPPETRQIHDPRDTDVLKYPWIDGSKWLEVCPIDPEVQLERHFGS